MDWLGGGKLEAGAGDGPPTFTVLYFFIFLGGIGLSFSILFARWG